MALAITDLCLPLCQLNLRSSPEAGGQALKIPWSQQLLIPEKQNKTQETPHFLTVLAQVPL